MTNEIILATDGILTMIHKKMDLILKKIKERKKGK